MLRLARLRPLVTSNARAWGYFPRAYSSTESASTESLESILQDIAPKEGSVGQRSTLTEPHQWANRGEKDQRLSETNVESQLDPLNFKEFTDPKFGDAKYTTRSYDLFFQKFPALKHEVDTQALHAKLKYEQVYLQDHAHESKTVFKFKNVVTKNYRTISRSWPMARLDDFKFGNKHFLDEMYDDIEGKYLLYYSPSLLTPLALSSLLYSL